MARLNLSPPWVIFYQEINAFFRHDPDIKIVYDEEKQEIKLYVEDSDKAKALMLLLPLEKTFGNITLNISVVPANPAIDPSIREDAEDIVDLYQDALYDNPIVEDIIREDIPGLDITYIVFKKEVVQYFTDNLGELYGMHSTLYQDIAKDIFFNKTPNIFFCTSVEDDVWKYFS